MFLELTCEEILLLRQLVQRRLSALRPEVVHEETYEFASGTCKELETLEQLLHRLHECEYDVAD
jgi:hypothetical protein